MPTYVYRREDGSVFELEQRITEAPLEVDPETGQRVRRVISAGAGLIFKGNGFYLTDYSRKGKAEGGAPTPEASSAKTAADPAAKPTAKPAAKPAAKSTPA